MNALERLALSRKNKQTMNTQIKADKMRFALIQYAKEKRDDDLLVLAKITPDATLSKVLDIFAGVKV